MLVRLFLFVVCVLIASAVRGAEPAAPDSVLNISASASVDVARDLATVVLSTVREGADAGAVQTQLKQALDSALAQARRVAQPGQLEVQTGAFSLSPRYAPPNPKSGAPGGITGWQGSAELIVEGKDLGAIGQLAGRIDSLTVARVSYGLSRESRAKAEGELAADAIARFRVKAADYARHFGYAGYTIREVHVSTTDAPGAVPVMAMRERVAVSSMAATDPSVPMEAGKASLAVSVNGAVQMTK
jgi:predicted secreted protein